VIFGKATFEREGRETIIDTETKQTIVEYESFDILAGEIVRINQPNDTSRILNRVPHGDPTRVNGNLISNGYVYILNPAGVFLGDTAVIDVSGLVAGAGHVSDADFVAGLDRFSDLSGDVVVAEGASIEAEGLVALVGRRVANFGVIRTEGGMVALVAGENAMLAKIDGRVVVRVDDGAAPLSGSEDFALTQAGTIDAGSGRVSLTAGDTYSLAMNHTGITRGREIELEAQGDALVQVAGTLDASTSDEGRTGGSVQVLGGRIALRGAELDASGAAGGGRIRVGGDVQGGGELPTARRTYVDSETRLAADATREGDGGEIVVWAEEKTGFYGTASARGGEESGDGGFIEISGAQWLEARGEIALDAPNGDSGTLLYDPDRIEIVGGGPTDGSDVGVEPDLLLDDDGNAGEILNGDTGDGSDPFVIYESEIEGTDASIVLQAENEVFVSGDFTHEADGEGENVVVVMPGNDLTIQTVGSDEENVGLHLTLTDDPTDADLRWRVSDGGTILLDTSAGSGNNPVEGVNASIEVGTLEFGGRAFEMNEDLGFELPLVTGRTAVAVSTLQGDIRIDRIEANGSDAEDLRIAGPAGGVAVIAQSGDVTVGSIQANGGDAAGFVSNGGGGGAISITALDGNVTIEGGIEARGGDSLAGTRGSTPFSVGGSGGEVIIEAGSIDDLFDAADPKAGIEIRGDVIATGGDAVGFFTTEDGSFSGSGGVGGRIEMSALRELRVDGQGAPVVLDVSAGDGSGDGGDPTFLVQGQPAALVNAIEITTPTLAEGLTGGDIVLVDTSIVARGGDAGLAGGPGGTGGDGANVLIQSASGSVIASTASFDASAGDGGFGVEGPDAVPGWGGAGGLVNVSGRLGAAVGDIAVRGGVGENGPGGRGGRVIVSSADGEVAAMDIDASGGSASENIEALEGVAGGAGGTQVALVTGDGSAGSDAGDVVLGGIIRGFGGEGQDADGAPVYAEGAFVVIEADAAVRVANPDTRIEAGSTSVEGASVSGVVLAGTPADDDRAIVGAEGPIDVVLAGSDLESLDIVQRSVASESHLVRSGTLEEMLAVTGDEAARTQTVVTMRTSDGDPALGYRLDEELVPPDDESAAPDPATLVIGAGAVALGSSGGSISSGRSEVAADNAGAIVGGAGGSHVVTAGDFTLDGRTIGTDIDPIEVRGAPEAALRLAANGDVRVDVDTAFGAIAITQSDAAAAAIIGGGAGDVVTIASAGSETAPVSRLEASTADAGFAYHLVAETPENGEAPDIEVAALYIGGSVLLDTSGDIAIAAPGAAQDATIAVGDGSDLVFLAGGDVVAVDPGAGKVSIDMGGSDESESSSDLAFAIGGSVGEAGAPIVTRDVERVAAVFQGGFHLSNREAGDVRIAEIDLRDPADLAGDDPRDPISGILSLDADTVGDVVIDNEGRRIVLGEIPGALGVVHVASTGDVVLGSPVEIDNAQFVSTVVDDGSGGFVVELEPENPARIVAQGDIRLDTIDTAAGATAVDSRTDIDEADRLDDVPAAGDLELVAGGLVTLTGDVGMRDDEGVLEHLGTSDVALVGDTRRVRAGDLLFRGRVDGPAALVLEGQLPEGSELSASRISFGGNVGTQTALGGLDVNADEIRFSLVEADGGSSADRVVVDGDVRLDTNQTAVPRVATIVDTAGGLTVDASGGFEVGGFEKISVTGALSISADDVQVADLSADRIDIDAPRIALLRRERAPLELADGSTMVDDGLDIVANEIVFSSAPTLVGTGPAPTLVLGSGGLAIPGSLADYRLRRYTSDLDAVRAADFVGQEDVVLDLRGDGGALAGDPARQMQREVRTDLPDRPPVAGDLPAAPAPRVSASQALAFLRCGDFGAIAPSCSAADSAAAAALASVGALRDTALDSPRALEITERYRALVATPGGIEMLRASFAEAGRAYAATREWDDATVDGADLYRFLAAAPAEARPALDAIRELAWLFTQIELLDLADTDTRRLHATLASDFADAAGLPGLTAEQVRAAVDASPVGMP
jgi:filamentous hemagglutinin family protein